MIVRPTTGNYYRNHCKAEALNDSKGIAGAMSQYVTKKKAPVPRLPLDGSLDLTYRCNNNCRHCWLRISPTASEAAQELTLDEIYRIVDEGRLLGTRQWSISGGEPMLRPDFAEILDYVTRKSATYSINTNGTLITPKIARLLKRKGAKLIALYGATAEVNDHVTRTPGSFDAVLRGMAYLCEAGAGFTVQLIPMKDNYHQWQAMVELAKSYSPRWRCGASWLHLSACGSAEKNADVAGQRLTAAEAIALDPPDPPCEERLAELAGITGPGCACVGNKDDRLFAACIESRREFHIDPYGRMSFCSFIKDSALRYDLRSGSLREAWEEFIPSLADRVRGNEEWRANCGSCQRRPECHWCAVYGYLETGRFSAPVPYLCQLAEEARRYKQEWPSLHRRHFQIAGITIRLESDLPIDQTRFADALQPFEVQVAGPDVVTLRHAFGLPDLAEKHLGDPLYRKAPWTIYRKGDSFIYLDIPPELGPFESTRVAVFDSDFSHGIIYSSRSREAEILREGFPNLTLFPTDQILVAQLLPARRGCYLHAAGAVLDNQGLLFVGHSGAGKSTASLMLKGQAEILCDDRMIVRRWPEGFKIHGTWSHGDVPDVSPSEAPLKAILFLQQSAENRLEPLDKSEVISRRLLACLIKPLGTRDWWERTLELVGQIVREVRCYEMYFDDSGKIVSVLKEFAANEIR